MRPLRLHLEGFTSFREATTLELAGLDLFAIAGPTGSGKTSLLDAMVFALYGTVPRMGSNHRELISLGRDRLAVGLDFALGGERYRVSRVMRRTPRSVQSAAQLERLSEDGEPEPLADGVKPVEAELLRLVGLSYEAFTQAAILPQGEFAKFLHAQPKERRAILRDLMRLQVYERMRQRADVEAKTAGATARTLEHTLATAYAGVSAEAVAELEQTLAARRQANAALAPRRTRHEKSVADLRARAEKWQQLEAARTQLAQLDVRTLEVKTDETRLAAARRAATLLPRLEQAESAARDADRARAEADSAERAAAEARQAHDAAIARRTSAESAAERVPEWDRRIEALGLVAALAGPLAEARRTHAQAEARKARAQDAARAAQRAAEQAGQQAAAASAEAESGERDAATAAEAAAEAERARSATESALRAAERAHAAAHVRRGLRRGDPCPVCERPLRKAPAASDGDGARELAEREAAFQKAAQAVRETQAAATAARSSLEAARAAAARTALEAVAADERRQAADRALAEAVQDEARASVALTDIEGQVTALGAEATDPLAERERLRAQRHALVAALEESRAAEQAAATRRATAEAAAEAARRRDTEAGAAREASAQQATAAASEAGFADTAAARRAVLPTEEQRRLADVLERYGRERHAAEQRVAALESELEGKRADPEALARAEAELDRLRAEHETGLREESMSEQRLGDLRERLEQAVARSAELEQARDHVGVYQQLARDLQSQNFQEFLLKETFDELVAGASVRLMELTSRYSLAYDDNAFHVLDADNAGERRRAETLSGGETFLAALALALELSQHVQRSAGAVHLDSLFIDEGFGALDPETLDIVAEALESLPVRGRMVGVVTHIAELNQRLPARIQVRKEGPVSRASVQID